MKNYKIIFALLIILFLTGCSSKTTLNTKEVETIPNIEEVETIPNSTETNFPPPCH